MRTWHAGSILRDSLGGYAAAAKRRGGSRPGYEAVDTWVTPSEVAEYVYCPEAHRLRDERPADSPRQAEGQHGHQALLERYRRSRSVSPVRVVLWLAFVAGLGLLLMSIGGRL